MWQCIVSLNTRDSNKSVISFSSVFVTLFDLLLNAINMCYRNINAYVFKEDIHTAL